MPGPCVGPPVKSGANGKLHAASAQAAVKPTADVSAPTTSASSPATPPGPAAPPDCRSAVAQPGDTPAFTSARLSRDEANVTSHVPAPSSMWSRAPPFGEYADSVDQTAARAS